MPKENTHLFFAHSLLKRTSLRAIGELLHGHQAVFFLGSVLPDAFFYHPRPAVQAVSRRLHGTGGRPSEIVAEFIRTARDRCSLADLAFTFGYLSHCALDQMFHPLVVQLTGDYHDPDPVKRAAAKYRHRLLETALDRRLNRCCYVDQMIAPHRLNGLGPIDRLSERAGVESSALRAAFRLQRLANRLFRTEWAYRCARILVFRVRPGLKPVLPLFYAHLKREAPDIPEAVPIPPAGEDRPGGEGIRGLVTASAVRAEKMLQVGCDLFLQKTGTDGSDLEALLPEKF